MSEIRVVDDPYPTVGGTRCLLYVEKSLCWLPVNHHGPCFPLTRSHPVPEPREGEQ